MNGNFGVRDRPVELLGQLVDFMLELDHLQFASDGQLVEPFEFGVGCLKRLSSLLQGNFSPFSLRDIDDRSQNTLCSLVIDQGGRVEHVTNFSNGCAELQLKVPNGTRFLEALNNLLRLAGSA